MSYRQKLSEILNDKDVTNDEANEVINDVRTGVRVDLSQNLMTVDDVSCLVQCSARHVRRMVAQGRFPKPIKIGRLSRWFPKTVSDWLSGADALKNSSV